MWGALLTSRHQHHSLSCTDTSTPRPSVPGLFALVRFIESAESHTFHCCCLQIAEQRAELAEQRCAVQQAHLQALEARLAAPCQHAVEATSHGSFSDLVNGLSDYHREGTPVVSASHAGHMPSESLPALSIGVITEANRINPWQARNIHAGVPALPSGLPALPNGLHEALERDRGEVPRVSEGQLKEQITAKLNVVQVLVLALAVRCCRCCVVFFSRD